MGIWGSGDGVEVSIRVLRGHVLSVLGGLRAESVHCVVTSPPYFGLRDYGIEAQVWPDGWRGSLGLEPALDLYLDHMVEVMREVRRVLRQEGTVWLNIGDSYAGSWGAQGRGGPPSGSSTLRGNGHIGGGPKIKGLSAVQIAAHPRKGSHTGSICAAGLKPKDLMLIPARLALRLQEDGWWVRSDIAWCKRAPMPESCGDRPTVAWEHVFLLTKSAKYFYDADAVKEEAVSDHGAGNTFTAYHKKIIENSPLTGGLGQQEPWNDVGGKRNMRNWWLLGPEPFPEAHFATFPSEIPRRAILAGTSERGVCPRCGAPWERVTRSEQRQLQGTNNPGKQDVVTGWDRTKWPRTTKETATIGWRPTCGCDMHPAIPATVLDPFFGAGTTGLVADQLQRDCIGIEINPAYAAMAERRLREDNSLFLEMAAE